MIHQILVVGHVLETQHAGAADAEVACVAPRQAPADLGGRRPVADREDSHGLAVVFRVVNRCRSGYCQRFVHVGDADADVQAVGGFVLIGGYHRDLIVVVLAVIRRDLVVRRAGEAQNAAADAEIAFVAPRQAPADLGRRPVDDAEGAQAIAAVFPVSNRRRSEQRRRVVRFGPRDHADDDLQRTGTATVGAFHRELIRVVCVVIRRSRDVGRAGEAQHACTADGEVVGIVPLQAPADLGGRPVGHREDGHVILAAVLVIDRCRACQCRRGCPGDPDADSQRARDCVAVDHRRRLHADRIDVVGVGVRRTPEVGHVVETQHAGAADAEGPGVGGGAVQTPHDVRAIGAGGLVDSHCLTATLRVVEGGRPGHHRLGQPVHLNGDAVLVAVVRAVIDLEGDHRVDVAADIRRRGVLELAVVELVMRHLPG